MKALRLGVMFVAPLLIILGIISGCSKRVATIERVSPTTSALESDRGAEADMTAQNAGDVVITEPIALLDPGIDENNIEPRDMSEMTAGLSDSIKKEESLAYMAGLKDIFFDFDRATLGESEIDTLKKNADWLKKNRSVAIRIEGYADERGTSDYNLALGEKRAQTIRKYLMALGITPFRMDLISYGEEKGFCAGHHEECWAQNRRGHFVMVEK